MTTPARPRRLHVAAVQLQPGDVLVDHGDTVVSRRWDPNGKHRRVELITTGRHRRVLVKPDRIITIERTT